MAANVETCFLYRREQTSQIGAGSNRKSSGLNLDYMARTTKGVGHKGGLT